MKVAGTHEFTLADANGEPHAYIVHEHPAGDGMEIMFELLGLGAPTLVGLVEAGIKSAELIRQLLQALTPQDDVVGAPASAGTLMQRVSDADLEDLVRLLEALDLSSVGAELGKAFASGKGPKLTRKILSRTYRGGKLLGTDKDLEFERAYQANYFEMLQAVWKVCQINRFFPVPSTSASSSSATK